MIYELEKEVDFALGLDNGQRFRVNAYFQRGLMAAALRAIPSTVPNLMMSISLTTSCSFAINPTDSFWLLDQLGPVNQPLSPV